MAPLTRLAIAIALVAATPARAETVARWQPYIAEASTRFGVPTAWIQRVMRAESAGHTLIDGRPIRSPKGAIGLMQLMPETWVEMRAALGLGNDPDDPRDNILAGTFYLRRMYDRFGYPGCFGAYNTGPGRYAAWLAGKDSLPRETIVYLGRVGVGDRVETATVAPAALLFIVRRTPDEPAILARETPSSAAILFAVRRVSP